MDNGRRKRIVSTSKINNGNVGEVKLTRPRISSCGNRLKTENKENLKPRYELRSSRNQSLGVLNDKNVSNSHQKIAEKKRNALNDVKNYQKLKHNKIDSVNLLPPSTSHHEESTCIDTKYVTFRDKNQKNFQKESPDSKLLNFRSFSNENLQESVDESVKLWTAPVNKSEVTVLNSPILEKSRLWKFSPFQDESDSKTDRTNDLLILADGIPSLKKKTLKKDLSGITKEAGIIDLDPNESQISARLLYMLDYLDDMVEHYQRKENERMLKNKRRRSVSLMFIPEIRTMVVNWLLKLQQYFKSDASVFFTAVQLLDRLLEITQIPPNQMQVAGLAVYWIAMKHSDVRYVPKAKDLLDFCCSKYSVKHIVLTERKILHYLNFDIPAADPMFYVRYFIYKMKLDNCVTVSFCSNYILDCMALDSSCTEMRALQLAAAAVTCASRVLETGVECWRQLADCHGYFTIESLRPLQQDMCHVVRKIQHPRFKYREPFYKYSTKMYAGISEIFLNKLASYD